MMLKKKKEQQQQQQQEQQQQRVHWNYRRKMIYSCTVNGLTIVNWSFLFVNIWTGPRETEGKQ